MVFAHDTEAALQAAVVLANSALEPDTLASPAELTAFLEEWEYTGRHDGTQAELDEVRELRPALRELLLADRDGAVALVNAMLADLNAVPQLVRHGRHDWHIHAIGPDEPLARRIVVETAMAMIDVIRTDEMSRLGVCADDTCDGVVLDLSRNRSRRYCSTACTNRNAVAAYRARQATAEA
ncbi:MAG: CGNR zinc finger domain-containing protein [Actinomycetales bacterium]|nr:CGNR zinc finger domain-containing protein [Actinomycetales bacterium]